MKYPKATLRNDDVIEHIHPSSIDSPIMRRGIHIRGGGSFAELGFYLTQDCDWRIIRDEEDELVLLPIKKGENNAKSE